jgi:hypothetical protein
MYEQEPQYQQHVQASGRRTAPDVAWDADPNTGFDVYLTAPGAGPPGWAVIGGTSAATPQWAALFAVANQVRAAARAAPLASAPAALYSLPARDFHQVAGGGNGLPCTPGYNLVTGLGTPYADRVIADLAASGTTGVRGQTIVAGTPGGLPGSGLLTAVTRTNGNACPPRTLACDLWTAGCPSGGGTDWQSADEMVWQSVLQTDDDPWADVWGGQSQGRKRNAGILLRDAET